MSALCQSLRHVLSVPYLVERGCSRGLKCSDWSANLHFLVVRREEVVQYLPSNTIDDIESNVEKIAMWIKACKQR